MFPRRHFAKVVFLTVFGLLIALNAALGVLALQEKGAPTLAAPTGQQPMSVAEHRHLPEGSSAAVPLSEMQFLQENETAMAGMMDHMSIKPTGDVDRDFVAMMVPHHQGAIDMAKAVLRYGKNEQIRRLAQEIIVTQQQEIAAMLLAIGEPLPPSVASPTTATNDRASQPAAAHDGAHAGRKSM